MTTTVMPTLPDTTGTSVPLIVELVPPSRHLFAGEWETLTVLVRCPEQAPGPVKLVGVNAAGLDIDADLVQRDLQLRPGEAYRVTVRVRCPEPGTVQTERLFAEYSVDDGWPRRAPLPVGVLTFRPSLRQVHVKLEAICAYDEGTKVLVTLSHQGATALTEFRAHLEPADAVVVGKTVHRSLLRPGEGERFEAVVRPGAVEVVLSSVGMGEPCEVRLIYDVPRETPRPDVQTYRFLEPRRLTTDAVTIARLEGDQVGPVAPHRGLFRLTRGKYRLAIRPTAHGVRSVRLRDVANRVSVLKDAEETRDGWAAEVEVMADVLFSHPDRLYYDIETDVEKMTGEIHFLVRPTWTKQLGFAAAIGLALTGQGVLGLWDIWSRGDFSPERVLIETARTWDFWKTVLCAFCILPAWGLVWLGDRAWSWLARD